VAAFRLRVFFTGAVNVSSLRLFCLFPLVFFILDRNVSGASLSEKGSHRSLTINAKIKLQPQQKKKK
jgi:hypothetical protein